MGNTTNLESTDFEYDGEWVGPVTPVPYVLEGGKWVCVANLFFIRVWSKD